MAKEITKKADAPLALVDYGTDAGVGYENQTAADRTMQFISIIQALSPQIDRSEAAFIEGAEIGDLFNTVTNQLLPDGVEFIPAVTENVYVEWVPRTQGGGFVARHAIDSPIVAQAKAEGTFGNWKTVAGNDLMETFYLFGVLVNDGNLTPAVIAFASTKIGVYKKWNTQTLAFQVVLANGRRQTPPLYAHRVRLSTVDDSTAKGKFKNLVLTPAEGAIKDSLLEPTDIRFLAAKKIHEMVRGGTAKVDYAQQHGAGGAAADPEDDPF